MAGVREFIPQQEKPSANAVDDIKVNVNQKYYQKTDANLKPMRQEAYPGLAGEFVKIAAPHTEACPEALLVQLLVEIGSIVGRGPWLNLGGYQHTNEYMLLFGDTGVGRKGTSYRVTEDLMAIIAPEWCKNCIHKGLQTGEALVNAIRDDKVILTKGGEEKHIEGVADKRLMLMEEEFARLLGVGVRNGNPLSAILRNSFDSPLTISTTSKTNPDVATAPHISIVAHVTPFELLSILNRVEVHNGFVNRFLFIESRQVPRIARAKTPDWTKHPDLIQKFERVLQHAKACGEMDWADDAIVTYDKWYLNYMRPGGSLGGILARTEAHIAKLSMIYAILDHYPAIKLKHLKAAFAVWDYAEQSARRLFGNSTGNKWADKIVGILQRNNGKATRKEISDALHRNVCAADLDEAFSALVVNGMADMSSVTVNGKLAEVIEIVSS